MFFLDVIRGLLGSTLPAPYQQIWRKPQLIALPWRKMYNIDKWGDENINNNVDALVQTLEDWYIDNRPENEVESSFGGWRAIWVTDDPFFVF